MEKIYHKLTIEAPASVVYEKLTNIEELKKWLAKNTLGQPDSIGGKIQFGDQGFNHKVEVKVLEENRKVVWEIFELNSPNTEWKIWEGTTNEFVLEEKQLERLGGKTVTILLFKHDGWPEGSQDTKIFAECNWFWGFLLFSLKNVCEGKEGMPI